MFYSGDHIVFSSALWTVVLDWCLSLCVYGCACECVCPQHWICVYFNLTLLCSGMQWKAFSRGGGAVWRCSLPASFTLRVNFHAFDCLEFQLTQWSKKHTPIEITAECSGKHVWTKYIALHLTLMPQLVTNRKRASKCFRWGIITAWSLQSQFMNQKVYDAIVDRVAFYG